MSYIRCTPSLAVHGQEYPMSGGTGRSPACPEKISLNLWPFIIHRANLFPRLNRFVSNNPEFPGSENRRNR